LFTCDASSDTADPDLSMTPVSVIDVAQHFAEYVNLVVDRGERFTLMREGKPVAELGPVLQVVRLEDLPALLASLPCLTPAAEALARDVGAAVGTPHPTEGYVAAAAERVR
jgi:antitoxin (DNA-binding transcriptional repressor) of toxin-antitoxin stability system